MPAQGGEPEALPGADYVWSQDGKSYFDERRQDLGNLYELDFESGSERQLTDFSGKPGRLGTLWDTDGEFLYFSWSESIGDIWVMDVESGN